MWLPIVFGGNPKYFYPPNRNMELILTTAPMKSIFNVKYLESGERYDVGLKGGQIGNPWALDWYFG